VHAIITLYSGMAGQAGRFTARRAELETLLLAVPGLVDFRLIETSEGLASLTVCRDRAACEECRRRCARWMDTHMPDLAAHVPLIVNGDVIAEALIVG